MNIVMESFSKQNRFQRFKFWIYISVLMKEKNLKTVINDHGWD